MPITDEFPTPSPGVAQVPGGILCCLRARTEVRHGCEGCRVLGIGEYLGRGRSGPGGPVEWFP